jgi:hypothetical protein
MTNELSGGEDDEEDNGGLLNRLLMRSLYLGLNGNYVDSPVCVWQAMTQRKPVMRCYS